MAANTVTLTDAEGAFSDWIEIYNPDSVPASLAGWYLTDAENNKSKWRFPAVTVPPRGFIVVFASNKNRTDSSAPLHTNFALSAEGEYLGLIKPDGSVAHEFAPKFPAQEENVSYGVVTGADGTLLANFLASPTPGAANSAAALAIANEVSFSRPGGIFRNPFDLALSGAEAGQQIRYVVVSGTNAMAAEVTAFSPVYSSPMAINGTTVVHAAVFSADGSSRGAVSTVYYAQLAPSLAGFSSRLPVAIIDSLGSGPLEKDGIDHPASFYLYPPTGGTTPTFAGSPVVASPLEMSVRGSSSALFPKKGYSVKFTDEAGKDRAQALLDLPAFEKWAFIAPWSFDLTYVNNSFMYALSNEIGRWAPQTRFVEVFHNTGGDAIDEADYAGIYVITDRVEIEEGRVDIASLSKKDVSAAAVTGGYLLKIDAPDDDEVSWRTDRGVPNDPSSSVVLVAPKAEDAAPEQVSYIRNYVQRMENALHADRERGWAQRTYLDYIDRSSWVDYHLLNTFSANPDAFVRSAYFHKDRGGKLAAGPVWDFDRALGSFWDQRSWRFDVWAGVGVPDYWRTGWWGIIAEDPEFMQEWVDRWQSLRRGALASDNLLELVDSFVAQIGNDAALRDATKWPDSANPTGSYTKTIDEMRSWIFERAKWIDAQFVAPPTVTTSGGSLIFTVPVGVQLAYTLDGSDPRSLGGEIAPNAELIASPLVVPASANVHVRSYNAAMRDVFPGSPWSSAIGGEQSSPLTPAARLVNISSRAIVGSGENALIAGVVVADTEGKRYLSRAVGPGLAMFGASGFVPDPQLSIFAENGIELFRNSGWESGTDRAQLPAYSKQVGAFPLATGSRDSALASQIAGGAYTVQVTTPSNQGGVGLAELYELDTNGRTVNLSTRAYVRTDDGVLIGGFVVSGPAYKRMLIRAVGPTLGTFGISDALRDPVLTIYSGSQIIATNDQWSASDKLAALTTAMKRTGAFTLAQGTEDAALLITLPPGPYTVEVKGKAGAEGVALLEIYELP